MTFKNQEPIVFHCNRRDFFKRAAAGGVAAAFTVAGTKASGRVLAPTIESASPWRASTAADGNTSSTSRA